MPSLSIQVPYMLLQTVIFRYFLRSIMSPLKKNDTRTYLFCLPDPSFSRYFLQEFCRTEYPETRHCPPFREDMFGFLHNYTNPRPIIEEEIKQVARRCAERLYYQWWIFHESNHWHWNSVSILAEYWKSHSLCITSFLFNWKINLNSLQKSRNNPSEKKW